MKKNTEWWWREFYDENGEIGEQAEWDGASFLTLWFRELKSKITGSSNESNKASNSQFANKEHTHICCFHI